MHWHAILILGTHYAHHSLLSQLLPTEVIACTANYACYNIDYTASQPKALYHSKWSIHYLQ
jgi:hypothetical protein